MAWAGPEFAILTSVEIIGVCHSHGATVILKEIHTHDACAAVFLFLKNVSL